MNDLNERAALAMGWRKDVYKDNEIYVKYVRYFDGDIVMFDEFTWMPTHKIEHAMMLVEELKVTHIDITFDGEVSVEIDGYLYGQGITLAEAITAACTPALEAKNEV